MPHWTLRYTVLLVVGCGDPAPVARAPIRQPTARVLPPVDTAIASNASSGGVLDCGHTGRFHYDALTTVDSNVFSAPEPSVVAFFGRAPLIRNDTVEVSSGSVTDASWDGLSLDSALIQPFVPAYPNMAALPRAGLFAVGRIALDSQWTAYLLRAPGMYDNSVVDLWPYHRTEQRFGRPACLAEAWGDAGDVADIRSWLVDLDGDGARELVQFGYASYIDIEADSTTKPEVATTLVAWRWRGAEFVRDSSVIAAATSLVRARVPAHVLPN